MKRKTKITLGKIAEKAGVSIATVSRFLRNENEVSTEKREKIEKAIKELDSDSQFFAIPSRKKRAATVALIVPDVENPFFASIVKIVELFLSRLGYSLLLGNSGTNLNLEEKYLDILLEEKVVDGIILIPSGPTQSSFIGKLNELDIPLVILDRRIEGLKIPFIISDNVEGGEIATRYLLSLGRKKIAFISGRSDIATSQDRMKGYLKALRDNFITFDESLVFEGDFSFEGGYEAVSKLLKTVLK